MKMFFDSSAFVKRYIEEAGSAAVESLCQNATELGLSVICIPEMVSALNRRVREGSVTQLEYHTIKNCLAAETADVTIVNLVPDVIVASINVLENNVLRAMDALHVACAVQWNTDLFVSSDLRQITAAKNAGLVTEKV